MTEFRQRRVSVYELPPDVTTVQRLRFEAYVRDKIADVFYVRTFDDNGKKSLEISPPKHQLQLETVFYAFDQDGRRLTREA